MTEDVEVDEALLSLLPVGASVETVKEEESESWFASSMG
jgi:hypothetical protein